MPEETIHEEADRLRKENERLRQERDGAQAANNQEQQRSLDLSNRIVDSFRAANIELLDRKDIFQGSYGELSKEYYLIQDTNKELSKATKHKVAVFNIQKQLYTGDVDSAKLLEDKEKIEQSITDLQVNRDLAQHKVIHGTKEERAVFKDIVSELDESIAHLQNMKSAVSEVADEAKKIEQSPGVNMFKNMSEAAKKLGVNKDFAKPFEDAYKEAKKTRFEQDKGKEAVEELNKIEKIKFKGKGGKMQERFRYKKGMDPNPAFKGAQGFVSADKVKGLELAGKKAGGGMMKSMKAGMGKMGKGFGGAMSKSMGGFIMLLKFLFDQLGKVDTQVVEMSKSLNLSKQSAGVYRQEMARAAGRSGDIFVTTTKMVKAQGELNKELGISAMYEGDMLVKATQLLEKVKLSGKAVAGLAGQSLVTGKSFEANYENALETSYAIQRQSKISVDLRKVMEQVGKTAGSLRAQLGGSTEAIAEAVTVAETLGMTLEQSNKAGRQLLNFEQSIGAELEAELITGKELNLERARAAALAGDQVTLAQELASNMGDWEDFTKMNVLQQEKLAAAVGMNKDELADVLFKQETQNKTARELRAMGKEDLARQLEQTTAKEKFAAAMEKLKSIIADILTPLLPMLTLLGKVVGVVVGVVTSVLQPVLDVVSLVLNAVIETLGYIAGGFGLWGKSKEEAYQGTVASAKAIGTGFTESAEGGGYVGGFTGAFDTMSDGIATGYGKRVLFEEGQMPVVFNDNDTIVASTKVQKADDAIIGGSSGGADMQGVIDAINNKQFSSGEVYFNSNKYRDPNSPDGQVANMNKAYTKFK
mgnify:CR=1 FL=1